MPVSFSMLSDRNLALVTFDGYVTLADCEAVLLELTGRHRLRPVRERLIDLSAVTGWDDGFATAIRDLAAQNAWLMQPDSQTLCVYYAPTPTARDIAAILARSWETIPSVVSLVVDDESEALAILGQTEARVSELSVAA